MTEEYKLMLEQMDSSSKIINAIFINLPHHPENQNHPETGRQNFYSGLAYECNQLQKCASAVIQEIINEFANDDGLIKVEDLLKLIEEWK
jgi:hypothetical protein